MVPPSVRIATPGCLRLPSLTVIGIRFRKATPNMYTAVSARKSWDSVYGVH
jgi:hypothetical protein